MKTTIWISVAALALAGSLLAQSDLNPYAGTLRQIIVQPIGSTESAIPVAGEVAPIAGKPYSAIGRTIEYSPDGIHVDRSDSTRVYRDDLGRTRREMNGGKNITIVDPVAGLGYNLQTENKTATKRTLAAARPQLRPLNAPISLKMMGQTDRVLFETVGKLAGINVLWDPDMAAPVKNQFSIDLQNATLEQVLDSVGAVTKSYWTALGPNSIFVTNDVPNKRPDPAMIPNLPKALQLSLYEAAQEQAKRMSGGGRGGRGNAANVTVDDLGTQMVNGVSAQGVRTTSIIPTGTFGNDHDIKTVTERWVSSDLHVLVKSVYTDSRAGATTYDLINITQAQPDSSLFQVPNGYTLQEAGRGGRGMMAPPPVGGR
jgi:hypothetical protein